MLTADGSQICLVESQQEFEALCTAWSARDCLAIDTEFIRTNTFYPKIGLLQLNDTTASYLIDPHCISNWVKFTALFNNEATEFCVHSCSEDLNLLQTSLATVPNKIFDSQLAAAFLGLGFSLSYQALVKLLLGQDIPKDETRSDWLKRPLSSTQLEYAANDVCYLLTLRDALLEQLQSKNVFAWFEEECALQIKIATEYENQASWRNTYTTISNAWKLDDEKLERLQQLCFWRELKARERNKPRNWIAKDSDLFSVANQNESELSTESLENLSLSDRRIIARYGAEIVELINSPLPDQGVVDRTLLNFPLRPPLRKKLKSCQAVVAVLAEKLSMAPGLLARKRLLQDLLRDYENHGELRWQGELAGWRRELLEPEIKPLFS
ncbi:MAG: ribonuclease D [Pseudomonadales bacterium]|nr:ribonuclease D [Pseudomonadales bacterium]